MYLYLLIVQLSLAIQLLLSWSGLSLAFWGYFYPLCLVHIVVNNDILQRVLRSVTKNCEKMHYSESLYIYIDHTGNVYEVAE